MGISKQVKRIPLLWVEFAQGYSTHSRARDGRLIGLPSHPGREDMAPPTVAQTLALAVSARGGTPGGNEDALVTKVRQRLDGADAQSTEIVLRAWLIHGVAPLVDYLKTCHTEVAT